MSRVKFSSNAARSDGTSSNVGNKLGTRPSVRLLEVGARHSSGAGVRAALFGDDEDEVLAQARYDTTTFSADPEGRHEGGHGKAVRRGGASAGDGFERIAGPPTGSARTALDSMTTGSMSSGEQGNSRGFSRSRLSPSPVSSPSSRTVTAAQDRGTRGVGGATEGADNFDETLSGHDAVRSWLAQRRLGEYADALIDLGVDAVEDLLTDVGDDELDDIAMKPLHRRRFYEAISGKVQRAGPARRVSQPQRSPPRHPALHASLRRKGGVPSMEERRRAATAAGRSSSPIVAVYGGDKGAEAGGGDGGGGEGSDTKRCETERESKGEARQGKAAADEDDQSPVAFTVDLGGSTARKPTLPTKRVGRRRKSLHGTVDIGVAPSATVKPAPKPRRRASAAPTRDAGPTFTIAVQQRPASAQRTRTAAAKVRSPTGRPAAGAQRSNGGAGGRPGADRDGAADVHVVESPKPGPSIVAKPGRSRRRKSVTFADDFGSDDGHHGGARSCGDQDAEGDEGEAEAGMLTCNVCGVPIDVGETIVDVRGGGVRHRDCAVSCDSCGTACVEPKHFAGIDGDFCSEVCALRADPRAPRCCVCGDVIVGKHAVSPDRRRRHHDCAIACTKCGTKTLTPKYFEGLEGGFCTAECAHESDPSAVFCTKCRKIIVGKYVVTVVRGKEQSLHPGCAS